MSTASASEDAAQADALGTEITPDATDEHYREITNNITRMSAKCVSAGFIREQSNSIITMVDTRLGQHVAQFGMNVVTVELPTSINVTGHPVAEILVLVYSNVFRAVEKAGYRTLLHAQQNPTRNCMYIIWQMKVAGAAYERAQGFVSSRCINQNKPLKDQITETYDKLVAEESESKRKGTKKAASRATGRDLQPIETALIG